MATTTNYSWTTPDDTALVKDGAAAIRSLGTSIDTTTKALNPSTTLGDIEYRSATANTNTRLAIGTTGQVLSVSGGVPAWSTASSGSMTQLATGTFSGSSISLTSISGSYKDLRLVTQNLYFSLTQTNLMLQVNSTSGIYSPVYAADAYTDATSASVELARMSNTDTNSYGKYEIPNYTGTSFKILQSDVMGRAISGGTPYYFLQSGVAAVRTTSAITSIQLTPSQGTFSGGTYTLFGVN
jgi:hypothetical protein